MAVQKASPEKAVEILTIELESKQDKISELKETIANLTAHNESMQADAVNNTATINMLMAQLAELKAPIEEIRKLKQALTDIRATTATLGDSQSAWLALRECSEIAGKALEKK